MNTTIVLQAPSHNRAVLIPSKADSNTKHRLEYFVRWLDGNGYYWIAPNLPAYRDFLMSDERPIERGKNEDGTPRIVFSALKPASAQAHLATIRGRYTALLKDNAATEWLQQAAFIELERRGEPTFIANVDAMVDRLKNRLKNDIDPDNTKVSMVKSQDRIDADHLRLTKAQADALVAAPDKNPDNTPLQVLRDQAMIALLLSTGIREMELCNLDVLDLRQKTGGELVLHVRHGKGDKERTVPYGEMSWALTYVDDWLEIAGITSGPVFRGFYNNGLSVRPNRLTLRAVNQVMDKYPIVIDGTPRRVNPHDCRRTYARLLYEAAVDPVVIQQNLGHSDLKTTLAYIGALDMELRRPPAIISQPDMIKQKALKAAAKAALAKG